MSVERVDSFPDDSPLAQLYLALVFLVEASKEVDATWLKKAVELMEDLLGEESLTQPETADVLYNTGVAHVDLGRWLLEMAAERVGPNGEQSALAADIRYALDHLPGLGDI